MPATDRSRAAEREQLLRFWAGRLKSEYENGSVSSRCGRWDAVVITASGAAQAETYERLLARRRQTGLLPEEMDFIVIPDKNDERIGSGGSTLSVIRELKARYGSFAGKRFLCLHAGGFSQRCPQDSVLGKLFCPIPAALNGRAATLFDLLLFTLSTIPDRMNDGVFVAAGDILLLFDPVSCELDGCDAAILTVPEDAEICRRHGVCVKNNETGNVKLFLHKQPVSVLQALGAADKAGRCLIDTGAVYLGTSVLEALYALIDSDEKYNDIVNETVRLSLYGDVNYTLSEDADLTKLQQQQPEGRFCPALTAAREQLWNAVGRYQMKCVTLQPAEFIHFGSLPEVLRFFTDGAAAYEPLGWSRQINSCLADERVSGYDAVLSPTASVGENCYLEVSYVHGDARIGRECLLSFVEAGDGAVIPDRVLVHGLKQKNGAFVCRIIGLGDDPKEGRVFGLDLEQVVQELGLREEDLWHEGDANTLWNAKLFPECASMQDALSASLAVHAMITQRDKSIVPRFLNQPRASLCSAAEKADAAAGMEWIDHMEDLVRLEAVKSLIRSHRPATEATAIFQGQKPTERLKKMLGDALAPLDKREPDSFMAAVRLLYYFGVGTNEETYCSEAFSLISEAVQTSPFNVSPYQAERTIAAEAVDVELPLRVNWGGTWSDTCPYCLEHGGAMLNAAITFSGACPVKVRIRRSAEHAVTFVSDDMHISRTFDSLEQLQQTGDPYDPFALQKACLIACGIIPDRNAAAPDNLSLDQILTRLGGGFVIDTEVTDIPRGSGLGTSSILSAAVVKALLDFTATGYDNETLYAAVLAIEQIMSTGGGWQDQVGGVTPGVKFSSSSPGLEQRIQVERLCLSEKTKAELNRRFVLLYTGQKRLAKSLLREVVGRYIANDPESVKAHDAIKKSALQMRAALERGDLDGFAAMMDRNWSFNSALSENMSNAATQRLLDAIDDLICAKYWCGAGGGGFLQVILKPECTKEDIRERLRALPTDSEAMLCDCQLLF